MQQPIELTAWQLSVAVSLILISAVDLGRAPPGPGPAALAGGRPHHGPTAVDRLRAEMALRTGAGLVLRAGHDVGHDAHCRHLGRAAERPPLRRHLDRQHHLDVGHELADDGHRPVRHRAGPRGGGTPVVVQSALRHPAVGHDPGQHHQRRFAQPRPPGPRVGLQARPGRDPAGPGSHPLGVGPLGRRSRPSASAWSLPSIR